MPAGGGFAADGSGPVIFTLDALAVARPTLEEFAAHTLGLQLCFFEVLWTVERRLTHIFGRVKEGQVQLHFTPALAPEREDQCVRLASEVIAVAFEGQSPVATFGPAPKGGGWVTLMSQDIFETLAQEVAPWRLEQGR